MRNFCRRSCLTTAPHGQLEIRRVDLTVASPSHRSPEDKAAEVGRCRSSGFKTAGPCIRFRQSMRLILTEDGGYLAEATCPGEYHFLLNSPILITISENLCHRERCSAAISASFNASSQCRLCRWLKAFRACISDVPSSRTGSSIS